MKLIARKPYRIGLLFTHKNDDFGAISVTERSCAGGISNSCATLLCSVNRYLDPSGSEKAEARTGIQWDGSKYSGVRTGI